jgi:hypothetical protein
MISIYYEEIDLKPVEAFELTTLSSSRSMSSQAATIKPFGSKNNIHSMVVIHLGFAYKLPIRKLSR